jgi:dihydroorotate dehydrogenase (NAD+) catalytic subunit
MAVDLSIELAGIKFKNPVMVASGTFGYGEEYSEVTDISKLGAIITKTVTLKSREGNPPPRLCETSSGMLNSIGLQNDGIESLIKEHLPFLAKFKIPVIVNIAGDTPEEFGQLAKRLDKEPTVKGIELNISCPNVKHGGMLFGVDPKLTAEVVIAVKKATALPVIAKLTPNVTDIALIAKAAQDAGADAVSLINTVLGMAINVENWKSKIAAGPAGLSGPAIKPIAVRMVYQVAKAVNIPVIGIGGIMTPEDAIEFFLAGASAVQIGTANFVDPEVCAKIINGIKSYVETRGLTGVKDLIGKVNVQD